MSKLTVAALQLAFTDDMDANIRAVGELVREAAGKGAEVVLPPELFEGPYFCRVEDEGLFANARPTAEHPSVLAMQKLADELKIWIPTSFFEAEGPHHYNSLAMIGPDGKVESWRPFLKSCMIIDTRPEGEMQQKTAFFVSHVLDSQPTEIHYFARYNVPVDIAVMTTDGDIWMLGANGFTNPTGKEIGLP